MIYWRSTVSFLKKTSAILVAGLITLGIAIPLANAQDNRSGSGLQISPTRTEINAQPGEEKTFSVSVKNVTQGDVLAKSYLNDFESDGATGTPKIITDTNKRTPYTINNMLKGLEDVTLKPGETKQVNLTIKVPNDVAPGAYFGAVRYAATPKEEGPEPDSQQVALTASVAHLVFVNVPGNVTEQIKLESLKITNDGNSSGIFVKAPNKASLTVKNLGNGFSRPFGNVSIIDSSKKEVFRYEVNKTDPKGIVLPNSTRIFDDGIKNIKKPGKYKAIASVAYGNGGEVVNYESSFWYLPWWFLAIIAVVVIALAGGGFFGYKKLTATRSGKK